MDNFDSKDFYGHSLLGDPQLRTSARNYEFKYNSSDHLERVINRVKMERETKKSRDSKSRNRVIPTSGKNRPTYPKQNSQAPPVNKMTGDTQVIRSPSRETIVKVMSDAEIEAMISQALLSRPYTPLSPDQSETSISLRAISSEASRSMRTSLFSPSSPMRRIEAKYPKISEELVLSQQPQWVQIKPAQKAVANVYDVQGSSSNTPDTVLDLTEDRSVSDMLPLDTRTFSLVSKSSSNIILNNNDDDSDNAKDGDTSPDSPMSFGIESPLNDCERAEMLRVLGHVLPHIPAIAIDAMDSQDESLYSDSIEDDQEQEQEQDQEQDNSSDNEKQKPEKKESHRGQQQQQSRRDKHQAAETGTVKSFVTTSRSDSNHSPRVRHPGTPLDRRMKKQIEVLKQEKMRIFSKMTSIQEKIIDMLDRLRISLVELSLPDGHVEVKLRERNAFEFSVRFSRNFLFPLGRMIEELRITPKEDFQSAMTNEPCVKVCGIYGLLHQALQCYHKQLRHFFTDSVPKKLDILLNMISETTKTCLLKKIFDQRDTLIQCLLLRCNLFMEFVMKFAEQRKSAREEESPLKSNRRDQYKLPRTSSKWELTMNLNNLNMYEPKLVPKVQKKKHHKKHTPTARHSHRHRESRRTMSPVTSAEVERYGKDDGYSLATLPTDPDETQVRLTKVDNVESVQIFNSVIEEQPESELTKTLIEALQNITKDEVRQMLGPIFLNLDSILRNTGNPESVESALSLLNAQLMAKYKQLKVDSAATENSPQTNNTDEKEEGKRSSSYRKEERQRTKEREHQSRHTTASKLECAISTPNVKQGSTRTTSQRDISSGRPNARNEKHLLSNTNIAIQHADKNDAKKRSIRSCSVTSDKTVKIPTPAVTASPLETTPPPPPPPPPISPTPPPSPSPPLAVSAAAPLNEVIRTPRSRLHSNQPSVSKHKMTSQRIENNSPAAEVGASTKQRADKFASERQKIGDGASSKELHRKVNDAAERKMSAEAIDATAKTVDSGKGNPHQQHQLGTKLDVPAGKKAGGTAVVMADQMETLTYCTNAMYTFVKCTDENPTALSEPDLILNVNDEDIPEEECFTDSCTRLTFSRRPSRNASFKSTFESTQNLLPPEDQEKTKEEVRKIIEERNNFIENCKGNPLYTNPQFPQPWKVLSKITHNIANEIVGKFENDLSFGEESYIRDFINMEMQT